MKYIRMNIDHGLWKKYEQWEYDKAPEIVRRWADNKDIAYTQQVCSIINIPEKKQTKKKKQEDQPKKETKKRGRPKKEKAEAPKEEKKSKEIKTCRGVKADGTPCQNTENLMPNGYCFWHQDQAGS